MPYESIINPPTETLIYLPELPLYFLCFLSSLSLSLSSSDWVVGEWIFSVVMVRAAELMCYNAWRERMYIRMPFLFKKWDHVPLVGWWWLRSLRRRESEGGGDGVEVEEGIDEFDIIICWRLNISIEMIQWRGGIGIGASCVRSLLLSSLCPGKVLMNLNKLNHVLRE